MMGAERLPMSCLDEETIAAFVEARLPPDGIAKLEAHVRDCAACRELVSLALAAEPVRTTDPGAGPDASRKGFRLRWGSARGSGEIGRASCRERVFRVV